MRHVGARCTLGLNTGTTQPHAAVGEHPQPPPPLGCFAAGDGELQKGCEIFRVEPDDVFVLTGEGMRDFAFAAALLGVSLKSL